MEGNASAIRRFALTLGLVLAAALPGFAMPDVQPLTSNVVAITRINATETADGHCGAVFSFSPDTLVRRPRVGVQGGRWAKKWRETGRNAAKAPGSGRAAARRSCCRGVCVPG